MSRRRYLLVGLLAGGLSAALIACNGPATSLMATPTSIPATSPSNTFTPSPVIKLATHSPEPTPSEVPKPATPSPSQTTPTPQAAFPVPPERDLYQLAAELTPLEGEEISRVVNPEPVSYTEGREDTFFLIDLPDLRVYSSRFELRLVTPHAYWYVEEGQSIPQQDIEGAAALFENEIYPRVTATFGEEWSPGVDNDPHLNIVNARVRGVGGYYSSSDEYPRSVYQFSNQRELIYINTGVIRLGSPDYLEVLAHELQHAVHWNADPTEETWVNEGLSELAITIAGFDPTSIFRFLRSSPTSLVHWPLLPFASGASYGAASLFMHYLAEHYGDVSDLRPLLGEPGDGIAGITAYLKSSGHDASFADVFRDWAVANILDDAEGPYGYSDLTVQAGVSKSITKFSEFTSQIPQYAVEYIELNSFDEPLRLRFQGTVENDLLPIEVGPGGCWWGNSGDSINSTLTREVDMTGLDLATLRYQVWYNLEENWDYAYVEVSADGGLTWEILEAPNTSAENPIGNSFGVGYTGDSPGWIEESVDLDLYAGRKVLIRFQYVTDSSVNGAGICFRRISIPEADLFDLSEGWQAEGFVLTHNKVRQDYIVQVIQVGGEVRVTVVPLDEDNSGTVTIPDPQDLERLVVAVAALAPKTRQEAPYTLTVGPVD